MENNYYDKHAKEYVNLTVNANMLETYEKFLRYLPFNARILDAGCGSGRDSIYFLRNGYDITMIDASIKMCHYAEQLTGQKALHVKFEEIHFEKQFDGIWACASLLHVPEKNLENIIQKFCQALKDNGIMYASWKYGEEERKDGERFYCDMTEDKLKNILSRVNVFECLECWISDDVLAVDRGQKWLNVVLKKR